MKRVVSANITTDVKAALMTDITNIDQQMIIGIMLEEIPHQCDNCGLGSVADSLRLSCYLGRFDSSEKTNSREKIEIRAKALPVC